ncbi:MAG: heparinase II/III family protein [Paludibacteraceae bacterium]|nr:heparinase II/III family protein [Paludibacteraceae bacterium]
MSFSVAVLCPKAQAARIEQYRDSGATYLSDRLQMHWNTCATTTYIKGEFFDHLGEEQAPAPTVRLAGARSHVTDYRRPKLEELRPREEDPRGMWLFNTVTQTYKWAPVCETGGIISSINREICALGRDAARRYAATGDTVYRDIAWNILFTYMQGVYYTHMPQDITHGHMQTLVGLQTFEVIHEEEIPFLTEIYRLLKSEPSYMVHGTSCIEPAFKHWADIIEQNGVPHNNWDLMQARFIFNIGQCLQPDAAYADGKGREHYFDIVENKQSVRQWSLRTLTDYGYDPVTAIWCECPGYSQVVLGDLAEFVRLYREELDRDLIAEMPIIRRAAIANAEYLYPDSMIMGFGDTHPHKLKPEIYAKLGIDMRTLHPSRMFAAPKTSWLVQRTGMDPQQSLAFSLNASQGNHMHANGINMELYGCGLRMAPDAGIGYSLYSGDDYKEYYSRFPAHNTVCVDGVSDYPVMMSQQPFQIIAMDTLPVQYAEVYMMDSETRADQQRLVMMTKDYFIDIFRSRRQDGQDKFHDYFYHNLGTKMTMDMTLTPSDELAFAGGHLYAYSYLYDVQSSQASQNESHKPIVVTYSVPDNSMMTQWAMATRNTTYFRALAPSTEGLSRLKDMPYDIRNTPTLTYVSRHYGEAWTTPFVNVFEPTAPYKPSVIECVEFPEVKILDRQTTSAVAVLVVRKDGKKDLFVSTDNPKAKVKVNGKTYKGRLICKYF